MNKKNIGEIKNFVEHQKMQLGLNNEEAQALLQQSVQELEQDSFQEVDLAVRAPMAEGAFMAAPKPAPSAAPMSSMNMSPKRKASGGREMTDPYLPQSQTIRARPTGVSKNRSLFYEMALPNEYIMQIGVKGAKPILGGKFFKLGKQFLKFPAAVQTVYFTSDNANKNYQGLKIDGYACWHVDPERPEAAAANLDFSDGENPMGNTNRILRTICTEAIRHIIANISIDEALTKKDDIGRGLKAQLERIEKAWGIVFDQVGIERVTILSSTVFDDLQQKARDELRLAAAESRIETNGKIERRESEHYQEKERLRNEAEKSARILKATVETEIHNVENEQQAKRESEERRAREEKAKLEREVTARAAEQEASQAKRQTERQAEIQIAETENESKVVQARLKSELIKAQTEHERKLKIQELDMERAIRTMKEEQTLAADRQAAELAQAQKRFAQMMQENREKAQQSHEFGLQELERLRMEHEFRNVLSETRVLANLVENLPAIAASIKIDRYTVLNASDGSPLTHTVSQVLSLLDEHKMLNFLKNPGKDVPDKAD